MRGNILFRALDQAFAKSTYFLATIGTRTRSHIQRISGKVDEFEIEGKLEFTNKKIAVLALFPRSPLRTSMTRLATALVESNFHIVAVINESGDFDETTNWIADLDKFGATIIRRPNIGRDFGAFRKGYLYLERTGALSSAEALVFANDSCYYGPNSIEFTKKTLQVTAPWFGMFVNYTSELHMQSFFQVFAKEIFNTSWFTEYWRNYRVSELRHLTIRNGEIDLSVTCRRHGFTPRAFVTAEQIIEDKNFDGFTSDEESAIWRNFNMVEFLNRRGPEENLILFKRQFLDSSVVHHHGLVASRILGAPLKLDLFQSGLATNEGLRRSLIALGCDQNEREQLIDYMNRQGSAASISGFRRLWRTFGLI